MLFSYGLLWFAILELFGNVGYTIRDLKIGIYYSGNIIYYSHLHYPASCLGIPERLSLHGHQNDISSKLW